MKKNKMMRVASVLLVAVLLTTSVISGTFAKYVTSDETADSARVAKFGVTVTASGSLFDHTYKKATDNTPGGTVWDENIEGNPKDLTALTVESDTNVVAPGTKNTTGVTFNMSGTPEVDVQIKIDITDIKEVFLKGTGATEKYPDMTTGKAGDKFALANDYYPVVFTLQGEYLKTATLNVEGLNTTQKDTEGKVSGTLAQIKAVCDALNASDGFRVDANTNLGTAIGSFNLTWEWEFGDPTNNKQDTLLGDIVATEGYATGVTLDNVALTAGAENDYVVDTSVKITVTVAQID